MPGLGLGMDAIDKLMTPDMIRGAANMMSNMDPNMLNSMMSMTGMPLDFDAAEAKRAAEKLQSMSTDEIVAMKNGAISSPLPGAPVCTVLIAPTSRSCCSTLSFMLIFGLEGLISHVGCS